MTTVQAVIALQILDTSGVPLSTAAVSEALERARVVAVLDGWADKPGRSHSTGTYATACICFLEGKQTGDGGEFSGPTPDAARAAAARAIENGEV